MYQNFHIYFFISIWQHEIIIIVLCQRCQFATFSSQAAFGPGIYYYWSISVLSYSVCRWDIFVDLWHALTNSFNYSLVHPTLQILYPFNNSTQQIGVCSLSSSLTTTPFNIILKRQTLLNYKFGHCVELSVKPMVWRLSVFQKICLHHIFIIWNHKTSAGCSSNKEAEIQTKLSVTTLHATEGFFYIQKK